MGNPNIKDYGFGTPGRSKEFDDEVRQKGLIARKGKPRLWTDEKIAEFIDEMLTLYKKILMESDKVEQDNPKKLKQETIMDMNTMMRRLLDFKEKYYPPIQKSISLNVETTIDRMMDRAKEEYLKKQGYVVVENEK